MRLLLVRHAMGEHVGRVLAGRAEGVPLNATGRAQAQALAGRLRDVGIAAVYSSPLERALATAQPIADGAGVPVQVSAGLHEFDFGAWTSRTVDSLRSEESWQHFNTYRSGTRAPGGELALEAQARAVAAMYEIAAAHPGGVAVAVSHADVIRAILGHCLGVPLDLQHRIDIDPASISTIELEGWGVRVRRVNETVS